MNIIRINNRKNFLIDEIPSLHPRSLKYIQWWSMNKRRCIEGFWAPDDERVNIDIHKPDNEIAELKSKQWRYMTPNLYFYVNFGKILHKPKDAPKTAPKKVIRPYLRDIDWEFFYNWIEARGFSGFSEDDEYTCHRDLMNWDIQKSPNIIFHKTCYKKDGTLKQYKPAKEYLRQLYDKPMGVPLYENDAKGLMVFGSRGGGKSFWAAVGIALHEILFDSARVYDEDSKKNPFKVELLVGSAEASKSAELLQKTEEAMRHLPGEWGKGTKDYKPAPFWKRMSGTLGPNNKKNKWRHEYEKKIGGDWIKVGSGSNIAHVVYTVDNAEAGAGGRYAVSIVEEVGLVPHILTIHGSNDATLKDGTTKFGSELYLGTGGNVDKVQEAEIIFRGPEEFNMLAFDDEWEGSGKIGWFLPSYMTLEDEFQGYRDENGNTNIELGISYRNSEREKKKKAKSRTALDLEMMNYPIVPSEMFMNAKNNRFPVAELKARLNELKAKPHQYENANYHGELVWLEGKLLWQPTSAQDLVRKFPIIDNSQHPGVIEIFEMPRRDYEGNPLKHRYIQGTDTYDDDESSTSSLGSTFIFDLWTERIVAEYTGRRMTNEFWEIVRKLNIFYGAQNNYENNKKGLFQYYERKQSLHWLCDTPQSLKDVADYKIGTVGNKLKGTHMTTPIIQYGMTLLENWLSEPAYQENGEVDPNVLQLHKIRSQGLLTELTQYKPDMGNYDRISAMLMVMILKADLYKVTEKKRNTQINNIAQDPFFDRFSPVKTTKDPFLTKYDEGYNNSNEPEEKFQRKSDRVQHID